MKYQVLIFILWGLFHEAQAADEIILLGGSGDPVGPTTIFESSAESLAKFKQEKKYRETVLFNGGHAKTEKMLAEKFSGAKSFSEKAYQNLIKDLNTKKVTENDRILIFINSHGEVREFPQKTHNIHCGDKLCNLDDLQKSIVDLEKKGAQVAVIDASCYSGATVNLGTEKTCVLTSSRDDSVGYSKTNQILAEELSSAENKNLEDVFLKAQAGFFGQGNINSEAGRETRKILNKFFQDFKNPDTRQGGKSLRSCQIDEGRFLKNLSELQTTVKSLTGNVEPEFARLREILREQQGRYQKAVELSKSTEQWSGQQVQTGQGPLSWNALANITSSEIEKQIQKLRTELSNTSNPVGRQEISDQIKMLQAMPQLKADLRKTNSDFARYEKDSEALKILLSANPAHIPEGSLLMSQLKILEAERSLYKKIYKSLGGDNPCQSFKL